MPQLKLQEITRKLLHVSVAMVIPYGIYYIPQKHLASLLLAGASTIMIVSELLRLYVKPVSKIFFKLFGIFLREKEKRSFTGATYMIIAGFFCSVFFDKSVSFTVLSFFFLGDAAAALVGIRFGRIKIRNKTLEGALACAVTGAVFWLVFPRVPIEQGISIAVLTAVLEMLDLKINDNLYVPLICGAVLTIWPF